MTLLRLLFDPPRFGFAKMTGPKGSNSYHATLPFGFSMIFLRICNSTAPLDALAARGMRFTSGTRGGCESADPAPADADAESGS